MSNYNRLGHLKWFERPTVRMVTTMMMAESVSRFRKLPTTSSFSCWPREILREWCFLNTADRKQEVSKTFSKLQIHLPALAMLNKVDTK